MGAVRVLLLLGLVSLFPTLSLGNSQMPCPSFSCSPGSYYMAKFIDRAVNMSWDEASDANSGVLQYFYFDSHDFKATYPDVTHGKLRNVHKACAEACQKHYNSLSQWNGNEVAGYWMFEQSCVDGPGGQCSCMSSSVCNGNYFSDEYVEVIEYGQYFSVAANYSVGKICAGTIEGDPHFTGADGSHFEFSGIPNQTFALISDAHVQVNAYLGGRMGRWSNRVKALTWMRSIAVMWGHHLAVLSVRQSKDASYESGYMDSIIIDGEPVEVAPYGTVSAAGGNITIAWTGVKKTSGDDFVDEYKVSVGGSVELRLVLRPEVAVLRTEEDAVIHFTLLVDSAQFSSHVHGVLGQTFRPDFAGRLSEQKLEYSKLLDTYVVPGDNAEGFIDGTPKDYLVTDIARADCSFCRFARGLVVDEETANALALSTYSEDQDAHKKHLRGTQ